MGGGACAGGADLTSLKRYTRRTILSRGVLDALLDIVCQRNSGPAGEANCTPQEGPPREKCTPGEAEPSPAGPPCHIPGGMARDFMTISTYVEGVGAGGHSWDENQRMERCF